MAKIIEVNGFDGFVKAVADLETVPDLFVLFSGSKNPAGVNWCSDCTRAEPVIKEFLKSCPDVVLLYVGVGDRDMWKNPKCQFRTDSRTRLNCVPTLMKWGTSKRLEEEQCCDPTLLEMIFNE